MSLKFHELVSIACKDHLTQPPKFMYLEPNTEDFAIVYYNNHPPHFIQPHNTAFDYIEIVCPSTNSRHIREIDTNRYTDQLLPYKVFFYPDNVHSSIEWFDPASFILIAFPLGFFETEFGLTSKADLHPFVLGRHKRFHDFIQYHFITRNSKFNLFPEKINREMGLLTILKNMISSQKLKDKIASEYYLSQKMITNARDFIYSKIMEEKCPTLRDIIIASESDCKSKYHFNRLYFEQTRQTLRDWIIYLIKTNKKQIIKDPTFRDPIVGLN